MSNRENYSQLTSKLDIAKIVVGLGVSAIFIYSFYKIAITINDMSSDVAKALAIASISGVFSIVVLILSKWYDRKRLIEEELRKKKSELYEDFCKSWIDIFKEMKTADSQVLITKKIEDFFWNSTHNIIVWSSDNLLKEYSQIRQYLAQNQPNKVQLNPKTTLLMFERLFIVMRRDLGHRNVGIEKGDVLSLFVVDVKKLLSVSDERSS